MRIGDKNQMTDKFKDIEIWVPFYDYCCSNKKCNKNVAYIKIKSVMCVCGYDTTYFLNAVNLNTGEACFVEDDHIVVIAKVHIEKD